MVSKKNKKYSSNKNKDIIIKQFINSFGESVIAFIGLIGEIVRTFGWSGVILTVYIYILLYFSTTKQKEEFIDIYFLGKGGGQSHWIIIICLLVIVVFWAQQRYYKKQLKVKQDEIDRLSEWKTKHQEKAIDKNLHHTNNN